MVQSGQPIHILIYSEFDNIHRQLEGFSGIYIIYNLYIIYVNPNSDQDLSEYQRMLIQKISAPEFEDQRNGHIYDYTVCNTPDLVTEAWLREKQDEMSSGLGLRGPDILISTKVALGNPECACLAYLKLRSKTSGTFSVLWCQSPGRSLQIPFQQFHQLPRLWTGITVSPAAMSGSAWSVCVTNFIMRISPNLFPCRVQCVLKEM